MTGPEPDVTWRVLTCMYTSPQHQVHFVVDVDEAGAVKMQVLLIQQLVEAERKTNRNVMSCSWGLRPPEVSLLFKISVSLMSVLEETPLIIKLMHFIPTEHFWLKRNLKESKDINGPKSWLKLGSIWCQSESYVVSTIVASTLINNLDLNSMPLHDSKFLRSIQPHSNGTRGQ